MFGWICYNCVNQFVASLSLSLMFVLRGGWMNSAVTVHAPTLGSRVNESVMKGILCVHVHV